jgi:DNA-directed RNA polymerase subunit RPC12/RpoP
MEENKKAFKCPNCGEEITSVNVILKCWQKAEIDENGKIIDYGSVEEIFDSLFIECPECLAKITNFIKD